MASVLTESSAPATADELAPLVAAGLQAIPYRFGRFTYPVAPDLTALQAELDLHRNVLVRLKREYAVLTEYDAHADTMSVRSGPARTDAVTGKDTAMRTKVMSTSAFMVDWEAGQRWAILVLRPGDLPAGLNRQRYLQAAAEFEKDARPESSRLVFDAALQRWPDEPEAWAGRAAAELHAGDAMNAARDYATALRIDGSNTEARHDLAMALLYLGCTHKAQSQIDKIIVQALSSAERAVVENSRDRIAARSQNLVAQEPPACAEFSF